MANAAMIQLNSVKQGQNVSVGKENGKNRLEKVDAASTFASMMRGNYSTNLYSSSMKAENVMQQKVGAVDSYDRYQYRSNTITSADQRSISDVIANSSEELQKFQENVISAVADQLDVSEDAVKNAMEVLGLTAFDLLIPENLAQLAVQLNNETSSMELLTNDGFLQLMQTMEQTGAQLLETLDVAPSQMDELIAQMDVYETPQPLADDLAQMISETVAATEELPETMQSSAVLQQSGSEKPDAVYSADTQESENISSVEELPVQETIDSEETASYQQEEQNPEQSSSENASILKEASDTSKGVKSATTQTMNEAVTNTPLQESAAQNVVQTSEPEISFASTDTMKLLDQVAEQIRVNVSEGKSSMEMQLNPENLGRVYVNISSKEGVIHAQLAASNEAVREALESQLADLRQNLNQAGVKVDAIEVTIASHGFEKNLEQNQQSDRQQGEREQEQQNGRRRNLNISGLDELSGLMTEEETLAAQIMRDNGNSVDMTA